MVDRPVVKRMKLWRTTAEKDYLNEDFMEFHYNPSEINVEKGIDFKEDEVPGFKTTRPQFKQGKARKFTFTLFLNEFGEEWGDGITKRKYRGIPKLKGIEFKGREVYGVGISSKSRPVEEAILWLEQHAVPTNPSAVTAFDGNDPPLLKFQCWEIIKCYITKISVKRTIFNPIDFQARRATVDLELTEYLDHPGSGGGGWCMIVTACSEGGVESVDVEIARGYRDFILRGTAFGERVLMGYYRFAPAITCRMKSSPWFLRGVRDSLVRYLVDYGRSRIWGCERRFWGSKAVSYVFMGAMAVWGAVRGAER